MGSNWGYDVPDGHVRFARLLIDAGVDVIHGHSSHHPRPIEVVRGKLVLYGCGELLDDYEGISGHEPYRSDLVLLYFVTCDAHDGDLIALSMVPMRVHRLQLVRASPPETEWIAAELDRASRAFRTRIVVTARGELVAQWNEAKRASQSATDGRNC